MGSASAKALRQKCGLSDLGHGLSDLGHTRETVVVGCGAREISDGLLRAL